MNRPAECETTTRNRATGADGAPLERGPAGWGPLAWSRTLAVAAMALVATVAGAQFPPAPEFRYGAQLDPAAFNYRREIPPGAAGIVELRLDAAALAHCRQEFADLRILAGDGRQVPYLIARMNEPLAIELPPLEKDTSSPATGGDNRSHTTISRYVIRLPYANLPPAQLVLKTTAHVFTRTVTLQRGPDGTDSREGRTIAVAAWAHAVPETDASPVTFSFDSLAAPTLQLIVDEGDNTPLPLGRPTLLLPGYRVRFVRPADVPLYLVYGNRDLAPARYDLALSIRWLLTSPADQVTAGPEPQDAPRRLPAGMIFWSALGASVVVLLALVARLVTAKSPGA